MHFQPSPLFPHSPALAIIIYHGLDLPRHAGDIGDMPHCKYGPGHVPGPALFGSEEAVVFPNIGKTCHGRDGNWEQDALDIVDLKDFLPPEGQDRVGLFF